MAKERKVEITVLVIRQDDGERRLIFTGPIWDEWDLLFCIHGEKLRWHCDLCEQAFKEDADDV